MANINNNSELKWLLCPKCGKKTRLKLREDTEMKNFPLYCPKCKEMTLVDVQNFSIIKQATLPNGKKKNNPRTEIK